jgi:hypothetical protein
LFEHSKVEQTLQKKSDNLDVQAMGMFLLGSGCQQKLISSYIDATAVGCNIIESAGCDQCREGKSVIQGLQEEASRE